jgi:hypothetical protein
MKRISLIFLMLLLVLPARAQSILGKHPADQWLLTFFGQNNNADNLIIGLNTYASGNVTISSSLLQNGGGSGGGGSSVKIQVKTNGQYIINGQTFTTNAANVLQAAMNALPLATNWNSIGGGEIDLDAGVFLLATNVIRAPAYMDSIKIVGAGEGATVILANGAYDGLDLIGTNNTSATPIYVELAGFTIANTTVCTNNLIHIFAAGRSDVCKVFFTDWYSYTNQQIGIPFNASRVTGTIGLLEDGVGGAELQAVESCEFNGVGVGLAASVDHLHLLSDSFSCISTTTGSNQSVITNTSPLSMGEAIYLYSQTQGINDQSVEKCSFYRCPLALLDNSVENIRVTDPITDAGNNPYIALVSGTTGNVIVQGNAGNVGNSYGFQIATNSPYGLASGIYATNGVSLVQRPEDGWPLAVRNYQNTVIFGVNNAGVLTASGFAPSLGVVTNGESNVTFTNAGVVGGTYAIISGCTNPTSFNGTYTSNSLGLYTGTNGNSLVFFYLIPGQNFGYWQGYTNGVNDTNLVFNNSNPSVAGGAYGMGSSGYNTNILYTNTLTGIIVPPTNFYTIGSSPTNNGYALATTNSGANWCLVPLPSGSIAAIPNYITYDDFYQNLNWGNIGVTPSGINNFRGFQVGASGGTQTFKQRYCYGNVQGTNVVTQLTIWATNTSVGFLTPLYNFMFNGTNLEQQMTGASPDVYSVPSGISVVKWTNAIQLSSYPSATTNAALFFPLWTQGATNNTIWLMAAKFSFQ